MVFEELNALNINGHTEKKKSGNTELTYLSWPWAWAEVKKRYEDASYTIWKDENNRPYILDPETGYMVYTSVTINGITHEMWLPVMDGANKAMRNTPYKYMTKYNGEKTCEAATMMDINKAIMRCLVKNLAMFGLGLYIYAGEDLPESEKEPEKVPEPAGPAFTRPVVNKEDVKPALAAKVDKVAAIPTVTKEKETKPEPEVNPVTKFLVNEMKIMREARGISATENNKLFKAQKEALIAAGLAPEKSLEEYTMQEAEGLIDAMWKCFDPKGTELKTE